MSLIRTRTLTNPRILSSMLGLLVVAAVSTSCTQIENPRVLAIGEPGVAETRSRELQRVQLNDIPVPPSFQYVTRGNRSYSFTGGGVRVARLLYWGKRTPAEVADFYRTTMPVSAFGWTRVDDTSNRDSRSLKFRKGDQECIIGINEASGATYVEVDVHGAE